MTNDSSIITLRNSDVYQYPLGISGDEEGAAIIKQAIHYRVSEIKRDKSTNWAAVYFYQPKENYIGNDYVEIELSTGSDGASPSTKVSVMKIKFLITQ
jgi:hypothetical protein